MPLTNREKALILKRKIDQSLRDLRRLDKSTIKSVLGSLRRLKIDISTGLKEVARFQMPYYRAILAEIDDKITDFTARMQKAVQDAETVSFATGENLSGEVMKTAHVAYGFPKLSDELLVSAQSLTADMITGMSAQMRDDIARSLRRSIIMGEDTFSAARQIDKIIGVKKTLGYMNRADKIARTEIGRTFSISRQAMDEQVAERVPEMKKQWITSQDERVRPSPRYPQQLKQTARFNHRAAHGQIRKVNEPFDVSGEKLLFPRDQSLGASAENVIGCRCQSVPYMEEWEG